tara:strand:- start:304 stop:426 length:123 start_codon:yes stop_codon:yes gene_type:complete
MAVRLPYYYKYKNHNITITSDNPEIVSEIMDILYKAEGEE